MTTKTTLSKYSPISVDEMAAKAFKVSSFTTVGHLLHINLKDNLLQHKTEIGEALLATNIRALAVVNKVNTIDNAYRTFDIEIIAKRPGCGKSDEELMIVEVKENKCRFQFDFGKVYWNSRLCTEHERIIKKLHHSCDIVFDLFAGVGPFSVPAAKAKCKTYANDLNPDSVKWLKNNMRCNKVFPDMYEITNLDAREYILEKLGSKLIGEYKHYDREQYATKPKIHIIMNLPALASKFLKHFIGIFKELSLTQPFSDSRSLVDIFSEQELEHVIYCYCFLKGAYEDPKAEVKKMIEQDLGRPLKADQILDIFRVRNVAPYKDMYRVEIKLDNNLLFDPKEIISIMKSTGSRLLSNGTCKKVTIQAPPTKRPHAEQSEIDKEEPDNNCKRQKLSDYCSII